jgi:hypothetical protein
MIFERDTMFGLIMDLSRLSHYSSRPKKILEQQRCSVSQERCSIEQQSNAGENPDNQWLVVNSVMNGATLLFGVFFAWKVKMWRRSAPSGSEAAQLLSESDR